MNNILANKFKSIIDWYSKNNPEETRQLVTTTNPEKIKQLQDLVEKPLPVEFIELYSSFNGEEGPGMGIFLAHSFLSVDEIINTIGLSKTFVKPEVRRIENPTESNRLINEITEQFKASLPEGTQWYKLEFMCAPNTLGYPYFYANENTTERQKEMYSLDDQAQDNVNALVMQLHTLEKPGYNWDELYVTSFSDGTHSAERKDFSFVAEIPFTSFPEGAIKKKYFNPNWIPVIFDNLGNYIGFDLDPDVNGRQNQIIVFGRDEEDMFVIADSFDKFLDFNLSLIEKDKDQFLGGLHLHDIYKKLIVVN